MKTRILWLFSFLLPLFIACNGGDSTPVDLESSGGATAAQPTRPQLVQMADGTFVTHASLVQNSDQIAALMAQGNITGATEFIKQVGDVNNLSASDRGRACAPTCITDNVPWSAYYYPPTYYNNNNSNININFNNFFYGNNYGFNGGQALGYYGGNYNLYPQTYQPWNQGSPYPFNNFGNFNNYGGNYGGNYGYNPQQFGQYYNPPPSGEFCNGLTQNPQFSPGSTFVNPQTYGQYSNTCFFHTQFGSY